MSKNNIMWLFDKVVGGLLITVSNIITSDPDNPDTYPEITNTKEFKDAYKLGQQAGRDDIIDLTGDK